MTRTDALFRRYEFLVAAAIIAAHANARAEGFRQREVRFLIELFSNWVNSSLDHEVLPLRNTQILRYLDELVHEAFAKRTVRQKWPHYRVTRTGLIELLSRLGNVRRGMPPIQFFFVYYFLSNYRPRLNELIRTEGKQFPLALRLEVDSLLDTQTLVERQLAAIDLELQKLEEKINDGIRSARLSTKLFAQDTPYLEVARQVEKQFPYALNSQKPLAELLAEIPHDIGRWEIETGGLMRAEQIFAPAKGLLLTYANALRKLR